MFKAIISDYFDDAICIIEFEKFTRDFFHTLTVETYLNTYPVYDEIHDMTTGGCSCKITNGDKWVCNIETWYLPHQGKTKILVSSPKNLITTIREIKEL